MLLFDLDGTVTDSQPGIVASFLHALEIVGVPAPEGDVTTRIVGPPMSDTFAALGMHGDLHRRALAAYQERYTTIGWQENRVFDGMADLLAELAAAGRTMAIATSKNERTANRILEHFGLAEYFAVIAGASDDGTRRAKADVIARALAGLGLGDSGADEVVMIGDRSHDVEGAAAFGIPAIAVQWGYAGRDEVRDAAWTVDTVDTLREVLGV